MTENAKRKDVGYIKRNCEYSSGPDSDRKRDIGERAKKGQAKKA